MLSKVTLRIVLAIATLAVLGFWLARRFSSPHPQPAAVVRQDSAPLPTPPQ
jgi:hypothetical protein